MESGARVRVQVYGGGIVERVASETIENRVIICTKQEYESALSEGRRPIGIGYLVEDVQLLKE